jgi:hypothetical protein
MGGAIGWFKTGGSGGCGCCAPTPTPCPVTVFTTGCPSGDPLAGATVTITGFTPCTTGPTESGDVGSERLKRTHPGAK